MDITGGQLTQINGNPSFPGVVSSGPFISGNVVHSDGSGILAGVGGQSGIANQGYAEMAQFSESFTQAASSSAGGFTTRIVLPAQSMLVQILLYVTTAWTSGTTTITVTDTASNSYTASGGGAGGTIGVITVGAPATKAIVQQWQNVGTTDVQLVVTSGGTGSGVGMLWVRYLQGCDAATST